MIELREYQKTAINELRRHIAAGNKRVLLVAPTGAGKTTIASEIIKNAQAKGKKVCFLAHRVELINQASARLAQFGVSHGIIRADDKRRDENALVQVASIQTLSRRKQDKFDLIIVDEAHRTLADSYFRFLEAQEGASVIGLTATPCRVDGKGLGEAYNAIVETCSIQSLVDGGVLVPAQVWGCRQIEGLESVSTVGGDYNRGELGELMSKQSLVGSIVDQWLWKADGVKTVVFAVNVEHSMTLRDRFIKAGVRAAHIDGTTPDTERAEILRQLRDGELEVITNCSILTEGWDLPDLGCVQIARPTKSLSLYIQMIGRGLRSSPGKDKAIILDHGACFQRFGHPLDDREWGLEPTKKHGAVKSQKMPGWQCKNCWYVNLPTDKECSDCGVFRVPEHKPPIKIKETNDQLILLEQRVSRVTQSGDRWLVKWAKMAPTAQNKVLSYNAICERWIQGGKRWKVEAIATKYRTIWGVWPNAAILRESVYFDVVDKAKRKRDLEQHYNVVGPLQKRQDLEAE